MKNRIFIFCLFYFFSQVVNAQKPMYSSGFSSGFLVQFKDYAAFQHCQKEFARDRVQITPVYIPHHIYLVHLPYKELLLPYQSKGLILHIQGNRPLAYRNKVPNDTEYNLQWSLKHIGMESLWEKGTGGVTSRGDTVVVAIIDAGFDTLHPDFGNNLWVNRFEISQDTTDNDGNGYAGDYLGWNATNNSARIMDAPEFAVHGMPIAGLVGAVGDNNIGIAGISWHNKFMIVVGGLTEADGIAAYGYVLSQKKRYIHSNGDSGAFVIAANTSWGRSAFPDDTPIWCAMYDSLGKYGILNLTSVDNRNIDIEITGDIPTMCPSPFILSTTATNSGDQLGGGYNKKYVDIAAPGSGIFSAASSVRGKSYEVVNGTSFASPHVTGVVSLLYSLACDSFIALSHRAPDSAALWMKYFIMKGAKKLSQLESLIVSGGRLDAFRSYQNMQAWCQGLDSLVDSIPPIPGPDAPTVFTLYPNPSTSHFFIEGPLSQLYSIDCTAITGARVESITINEPLSDFETLSIQSHFSPGVYIIHGKNAQGKTLFKIKWVKI
jgi:hypothetical protein